MTIARRLAATYAAALAALALTSPTQAEEVEFAYSPAELETPAGREALTARMELAARAACDIDSPLIQARAERDCRADLTRQWIAAIGAPLDTDARELLASAE